ncbi:MAG: 7-cyano-7-deazaguanine synthase, partial [Candidatus Bathyarchaeota archaeon]|nr:7-cyano-7-deazaguanine synthase [Candidatus Bathyarchaeota archaeon]
MDGIDPESFVKRQVEEIRKIVGEEKVLIAVSGGVDSTTCAVLTHRAVGENLMCITIDDGFRREGEPKLVAEMLSSPPLNLPIKIINVRERFLNALKGLTDAEEKRKVFRENFYRTLSEAAKDEGSRILVQGTILADVVETKAGIKTQHNVLEQIGINTTESYGFKVVEPLVSLYKDGVRSVARHLGIPPELSERQPFPGPGLLVRVVGEVSAEKLKTLKRATTIAERGLAKHKVDQYFAAVIDNWERTETRIPDDIRRLASRSLGIGLEEVSARILRDKATGVKVESRLYGDILALECRRAMGDFYHPSIRDLIALQYAVTSGNPSVTRLLYEISSREEERPYLIAVRAVRTKDFITAIK